MSLVLDRPHVFERGDRIYLTAPVQVFSPRPEQIEEYAFSGQLKRQAPNENIRWFRGQYVEADNPNRNGAQWRAEDLAIRSLTPMLMPVTVMHDPRTAVGTIADVALLTPEKDQIPRSRIDTVLALWEHRFPEVIHEADANARQGTLMQSMECYSPWYSCSECGAVFHKLPRGAEQATWCEHLKCSRPSGGYVDTAQAGASRILGDVTFTGAGLIFGTRGARGAYSDAHLHEYEEEVAEYHQRVHTDTAYQPRRHSMGLVSVDESELAALRSERDRYRDEARSEKQAREDAERESARKIAEVETAKTEVTRERDEAQATVRTLQEEKAQVTLRSERMRSLGAGFMSKLGDFTKQRLEDRAAKASDEDWDAELKSLEEVAKVNRDDAGEGGGGGTGETTGATGGGGQTFSREEVAALHGLGGGGGSTSGAPSTEQRAATVRQLGSLFSSKPRQKAS